MDNREKIADKLKDIYEYSGTPLYAAFVDLLLLLDTSYHDDFREVTPEQLGRKQGASKQLLLLRNNLIKMQAGDVPKL